MLQSTAHGRATKSQAGILSYWSSICRDGCAPRRCDIDPGAVRRHLANLSILAVDRLGDIQFRLIGSKARSIFGLAREGSPAPRHRPDGDAPWLIGLRDMTTSAQPVWGVKEVGTDRHAWVRMPLLSDHADQNLVLCFDALFAHNPAFAKTEQASTLSNSLSHLAA